MRRVLRRGLVALTTCFFTAVLCAQTAAPSAAVPTPSDTDATTDAVVIRADPFGRTSTLFDLVAPAAVLEGRALSLRHAPGLADALIDMPGVSSSGFGPNVARPVIRGMDGDRLRVLQNGVGMIDASAASPDHAVSVDLAPIERVEVVRGPAALLFGGNAVGGVVNLVDGRIATLPVLGVRGEFEPRLGGAAHEQSMRSHVDAGDGQVTVHADAYRRSTQNLAIPGHAISTRLRALSTNGLTTSQLSASGYLPNSNQLAEGGGLGSSLAWTDGYAGVSVGMTNSNYGTVVEPNVRIKMESMRWDAAAEQRNLTGPIQTVRVKWGLTNYRHDELDGGTINTTFLSGGHDARLELVHRDVGRLKGLFGLQSSAQNLTANGSEAFLPGTRNEAVAWFVYEELDLQQVRLSAGVRRDAVKVNAGAFVDASGAATASNAQNFAPQSRALGALWTIQPGWALASNLTWTQRAPSVTELYANGKHAATSAFEVGDRTLGLEKSRAIDLSLRKTADRLTGSIGIFQHRFENFIYLAPALSSGTQLYRDASRASVAYDADGATPQFNFVAAPAYFRGLEAQGRFNAWAAHGDSVALMTRADTVRATSNGDALPRIAPTRLTLGMEWKRNTGWLGSMDLTRVAAQTHLPTYTTTLPTNLPTDGYNMLNAALSYRFRVLGDEQWELYARGTNLGNVQARNAVSFLKDRAPLGGRALSIGLRGTF